MGGFSSYLWDPSFGVAVPASLRLLSTFLLLAAPPAGLSCFPAFGMMLVELPSVPEGPPLTMVVAMAVTPRVAASGQPATG